MDPENARTRARIWSYQQLAAQALQKMVAIGERHGIAILPVKGVISARLYYDDVSERPMQDVDVRVTPTDLAELRRLAPREGLKVIHDSPAYENLVFDAGGIMVEVEAHLGPRGVCAITIEELFARAATRESTFGFRAIEPELHDHALVLVVNAFKDKLVDAMPWALRDLARVVKQPAFEIEHFADRARRGRVTSLVWVVASFLIAQASSSPELPTGEANAVARWQEIRAVMAPPRRRYAEWMLTTLLAAARNPPSFLDRNALRLGARAASDSRRGRALALAVMARRGAERALGIGLELE